MNTKKNFDGINLKHGDNYCCRRLRMLSYLRELGFEPFATVPDVNNPKFNVWLFNNSPELEDAIHEYYNHLVESGYVS